MWDKRYAEEGGYLSLSGLNRRLASRDLPCPPTRQQQHMAMEFETSDAALEDWFAKKSRCNQCTVHR